MKHGTWRRRRSRTAEEEIRCKKGSKSGDRIYIWFPPLFVKDIPHIINKQLFSHSKAHYYPYSDSFAPVKVKKFLFIKK